MAPHLSELKFCGHIVTAGKETSSIGWDNVSTTVMVGLSIHAKIKKEECFSVKYEIGS